MIPNTKFVAAEPEFPTLCRKPVRSTSLCGKTMIVPILQVECSTPKIQLQEVSLSYQANTGSELLALDRIDLDVHSGEFLCIVGPSGCGKSTLLHLIAGLQRPTSGSVLVDEELVSAPGTDRILIFQDHGLFPWLTVGENVEFGMKMKGISKKEREERTRYYLRLG